MSAATPTLRLADRDDLAAVAALESESFDPPWRADDVALLLEASEALLLLAEAGDAARGYALFQRIAGEAELLRIGVARAWRGRGLGALLVAEGLERLTAAGDRACFLEVREGNLPARKLYERAGFRQTGRRSGYYADGEDALLFRLDLPRRTWGQQP